MTGDRPMPRQRAAPRHDPRLATALGLAGCGRKGKLEPPPEQQLVTKDGKTQVDPGPAEAQTSRSFSIHS